MRGALMDYYLKILLVICAAHELAGGTIKSTRDAVYKKYLSLRSLPFEDCGKYISGSVLFGGSIQTTYKIN